MMKTFELYFEETIIIFQFISLSNGIFLYVGNHLLNMENLIISIRNSRFIYNLK